MRLVAVDAVVARARAAAEIPVAGHAAVGAAAVVADLDDDGALDLAFASGPSGVRVNAIAPGWISTPMTDRAFAGDPVRKEKVLSRTPMKRMGEPSDIGQTAAFLCTDAAKFITGQCIPVDGGASIGF